MSTRILPHDLECERAVLGAVLMDDKAIHSASDTLQSDDFYQESHRYIFQAMLNLATESTPIDLWTLKSELQNTDKLDKSGGISYLADLTSGTPKISNTRHYASIIKEKSAARMLIQLGNELMTTAWDQPNATKEILESVQTRIFKISNRTNGSGLRPIADLVHDEYAELYERIQGRRDQHVVMSGLTDLDNMTGGFRPGQMIVVAGRTSAGKSALASNIATHAAVKEGKRVAVFSIEMSQTEIYSRMMADLGNMSCFGVLKGYLSEPDKSRIISVNGKLADSKIWVDCSGYNTPVKIRSKAERVAAEHGLDLIIIDYLQLVKGTGKSLYEQVTDVSSSLKLMAKDMRVPVIALSQLHRSKSETDEPFTSDLKESGSIENDASIVIMLWFEKDRNDDYRACKVAKNRNGPTGTINLSWDAKRTKFSDHRMSNGEPPA